MIYRRGKEILKMDLTNDIPNDDGGTSSKLAECFSLDHPEGPFHYLL